MNPTSVVTQATALGIMSPIPCAMASAILSGGSFCDHLDMITYAIILTRFLYFFLVEFATTITTMSSHSWSWPQTCEGTIRLVLRFLWTASGACPDRAKATSDRVRQMNRARRRPLSGKAAPQLKYAPLLILSLCLGAVYSSELPHLTQSPSTTPGSNGNHTSYLPPPIGVDSNGSFFMQWEMR